MSSAFKIAELDAVELRQLAAEHQVQQLLVRRVSVSCLVMSALAVPSSRRLRHGSCRKSALRDKPALATACDVGVRCQSVTDALTCIYRVS